MRWSGKGFRHEADPGGMVQKVAILAIFLPSL
jgi:hypothetical protein